MLKVKIDSLSIPNVVIDALKDQGIKELYPPQAEAVDKGLLEGNNLVVAIPTASGKTLLALLAAVKTVSESGYKVLYLSPLKALAYEKYVEFQNIMKLLNKTTVLLTGDYDREDRRANFADVIIATNEKIDSSLRHQSIWLKKVGLIIADEVHLVNSADRGPTLEVVLSQLKNMNSVQILALSATIRNADEISRWLEAELISSSWRPVKLREGVVFGSKILYKNREIEELPQYYKDPFINLIEIILRKKSQCIVFVNSRKSAEVTATKLAPKTNKTMSIENKKEISQAAKRILNEGEKTKQAEKVANLIQQGVAFHHAGLNPTQRRVIEEEFKKGVIKVLCATSTLAAGINLPARYVIIKSVYRYSPPMGSVLIPVLEFKQQSGRAGRPQYDKEGDALVIAKDRDEAEQLYNVYIIADTEDIQSRIANEKALRSISLGQIATGNSETFDDLIDFFSQTFYGYKQNPVSLSSILKDVIKFLRDESLIKQDPYLLLPTTFGKRVSELYIDPKSAIQIREGLMRASLMPKSLLTDTSFIHLACSTPDVRFIPYRRKDRIELMNFISEHDEEILTDMPTDYFEIELFFSQLKTALVIEDWINEVPEDKILSKYDIGSGDIYSVVSNAEWIIYATSEIAKLLGFDEIAKKVAKIHKRIKNGIKEELMDLVEIPNIGRARARTLFNNGYKTRKDLEKANAIDLIKLPGFGKELVRSIIESVKGEKMLEKELKSLDKEKNKTNEDKEQYTPNNEPKSDDGQKSLSDFL